MIITGNVGDCLCPFGSLAAEKAEKPGLAGEVIRSCSDAFICIDADMQEQLILCQLEFLRQYDLQDPEDPDAAAFGIERAVDVFHTARTAVEPDLESALCIQIAAGIPARISG